MQSSTFYQQLLRFRWSLSLFTVLAVAILDYYTGALVTFSAFYLLPLLLVSWQQRRLYSQLFIGVIVLVWSLANYLSQPEHFSPSIMLWNGLVRWLHLSIVAEIWRRFSHSHASAKALANTDTLTGLANRRAFNKQLASWLTHPSAEPLLLMAIIDIDFFKQLNDQHGHPYGDTQLQRVAQVIEQHCLVSESCARLGGDEFALLWHGESHAALTARLQQLAADLRSLAVPCSIGGAIAAANQTSAPQLYQHADTALYQTKTNGRGFATVFTEARSQHSN
ncbi:MAG TPA: hypothetical protein DCS87_04890 [Rheinheimera sp.]|nr:hypothetical protein [Rheinheimera sp.]